MAIMVVLLLGLTAAIAFAQAPQGVEPDAPALLPEIWVEKVAESPEVEPGDGVVYQVVFTNTTASDVALDVITDTLPAPFEYVILLAGSDSTLKEPQDKVEPEIVWTGPYTVPAMDTFTMRYMVRVPDTTPALTTPYTNTAEAMYGGAAMVVSAEAGVTVISPDVQVTKTAAVDQVLIGEVLTYTILLENKGNGAAVVDEVNDTLPGGLVYQGMLPTGTITDDPIGATGLITWEGPFDLAAGEAISLSFTVDVQSPSGSRLVNSAVAVVDGVATQAAEATVTLGSRKVFLPVVGRNWIPPRFTVTKEASAAEVVKQDPVIYTVTFTNIGSLPATLDEIQDTLPAGFVFQSMEAGSDVAAAPMGTVGAIIWKGPFEVASRASLTLIYKVRTADAVGLFTNSVTGTTLVGLPPDAPATATVKVKEPFLLWEDFESGTDGWEPFLNYWRLNPDQWYLKAGAGWEGSTGLNHNLVRGVTDPRGIERGAHDALYMYQGVGSDDWTDYRVEARVILREGLSGEQMGLWFRGKYTEPEDPAIDGKYVQGYYLVFRPRTVDSIVLNRIRNSGSTAYHFSDPEVIALATRPMARNTWYLMAVEVRGSNIKVYIDGDLVIDHNDTYWEKGTVGFFCYKILDATWDNVLVTPLD